MTTIREFAANTARSLLALIGALGYGLGVMLERFFGGIVAGIHANQSKDKT